MSVLRQLLIVLFASHTAFAVTAVDSTWLYGDVRYSNPANWSPAEVPNNTTDKSYNVSALSLLVLDIDATVTNASLQAGFEARDHSFTVRERTTLGNADGAIPDILLNAINVPVTFSTGILTSFSSGVLTGKYELNGAATLQFGGANITTLRSARLSLNSASARVIDENGNDALRNLRTVEANSSLSLSEPFTSAGDITIGGLLEVHAPFTISGSLTNFDAATRTLQGGSFSVNGDANTAGTLEFRGADIVNSNATIYLSGGRIVDEAGRDGLRNFAHNAPNGHLLVTGTDFVIPTVFTNESTIVVSTGSLKFSGGLANYDPVAKRLAGGEYYLGDYHGGASNLSFAGGDVVHNAATIYLYGTATITDENGGDALRNFADNDNGSFELVRTQFNARSDFTNGGTVTLYEGAFTIPAGHRYTQANAVTAVTGVTASRFDGDMEIDSGELGATAVRMTTRDSGGPAVINGNVVIGDATVEAQGAFITSLQFTSGSHWRYVPLAFPVTPAVTVSGTLTLAGALDIQMANTFPVASDAVFQIAHAGKLTGAFSNGANGGRVPTTDGLGSFAVNYSGGTDVTISNYQRTIAAAQLLNISTRAQVLTGNDVAIGGFIVYGRDPKKVVIRAIGPSLAAAGVAGPLQDPVIELHDSTGAVMTTNDNWQDSQGNEISATGLAPTDPRESAIAVTLQPGAYTAVVRGKNDTTGVALVEVYDLSKDAQSKLANISTRGFVDADHVLIGGLISGGNGQGNAEVVVRAIGPGLKNNGVTNFLADPAFEVRDKDGAVVAANDDFTSPDENPATVPYELAAYTQGDAATGITMPAGKYTVVVHGKNGASGNALVEIYDLNR